MKHTATVLSAILALTPLAAPVPSAGQQPAKVYRIGWLWPSRPETDPRVCWRKASPFRQAWTEAMQGRGYTLGQNLSIECRYTDGRSEHAQPFAAELVTLGVDLIAAANTNQVRAAKQATRTLPIVMWGVIDPVRRGLVASLARPGGNVTGLTDDAGLELLGKYLQLLKEVVPAASRIASLHAPPSVPGEPTNTDWQRLLEVEARALGVALQPHRLRGPEDLEVTFAAMTKARAEAVLLVPSPFFGPHKQQIIGLAAQHRLPAIYPDLDDVTAGGLMAYAPDDLETARRLAAYADRILKGAKAGDLPVEQPTEFKLILNLKTAKALGLTFPPTLLLQAEELIR